MGVRVSVKWEALLAPSANMSHACLLLREGRLRLGEGGESHPCPFIDEGCDLPRATLGAPTPGFPTTDLREEQAEPWAGAR